MQMSKGNAATYTRDADIDDKLEAQSAMSDQTSRLHNSHTSHLAKPSHCNGSDDHLIRKEVSVLHRHLQPVDQGQLSDIKVGVVTLGNDT